MNVTFAVEPATAVQVVVLSNSLVEPPCAHPAEYTIALSLSSSVMMLMVAIATRSGETERQRGFERGKGLQKSKERVEHKNRHQWGERKVAGKPWQATISKTVSA